MRRCLLDTAVFVYAVGEAHPYREPCRDIVEQLASGEIAGEASVELVQEFLHVRARRTGDREGAVEAARRVGELCKLHDSEHRDLTLSLRLFVLHRALDARDALYAATALNRGIDAIVATDQGFDDVAGLERIDPRDRAAMDRLTRR